MVEFLFVVVLVVACVCVVFWGENGSQSTEEVMPWEYRQVKVGDDQNSVQYDGFDRDLILYAARKI